MATAPAPLQIFVEGKNDQHALVHLLIRNEIRYDQRPWPANYPAFQSNLTKPVTDDAVSQGAEAILRVMEKEVRTNAGRVVGFVLDADENLPARWSSIRDRLATAEVDTPDAPPAGGFIGLSKRFKTRVGVWLMPDNTQPGALEHFLKDLIPDERRLLFEFAAVSSVTAKQSHGAEFRDVDQLKATFACWLAWQKNPGRPYGTAIKAEYLGTDSPAAVSFVNWFKSLYGITT